jgi:hypothetical protein
MSKLPSPKELRKLLASARPKRWSYSAYGALRKCARSLGLSYVIKTKQAPNEAMIRGEDLHKKAEYFLKGEIDETPKILKPFERELKLVRKLKPVVEQFWNANEDFSIAKEYQGWCVFKMDAVIEPQRLKNVAWMADHKSGREHPEHEGQAELGAVFMFGRYPKIEAAEFEFWYYDAAHPLDKVARFFFDRSQLYDLKDKWQENGHEVMAERRFLPSPSENACRFCAHRSHDRNTGNPTGGVCQEWKRIK